MRHSLGGCGVANGGAGNTSRDKFKDGDADEVAVQSHTVL